MLVHAMQLQLLLQHQQQNQQHQQAGTSLLLLKFLVLLLSVATLQSGLANMRSPGLLQLALAYLRHAISSHLTALSQLLTTIWRCRKLCL